MLRYLFKRHFSSGSVTATTTSLTLRPYQDHCLDTCADALATGASRIGVSLPTGSGKTTVFISLLSRISPPASNLAAQRSLIIVNSIELARQSANQVALLFPSWSVEIEQGAKHTASGTADVTVATYQTLLNEQRLAKFDPRQLKAIIIDEAHHAAAPSYRRILSHFHSKIKHPDKQFKLPELPHKIPIIGFSATFSRHDGLALGSVFEKIVYHRDFLQMIKEQWLCDVRFTSVAAKINLKDVTINTRTGDFNPTSLSQVINTESVNELVVKTWLDRAATRKSTLIFCVDIAHVVALTQTFRRHGIDARHVYSQTPVAERKALIASFKTGQYPVLINCAILTEGADIPNIDCVIVARPTRSRNVFAQMIGRGMRLSPDTGKKNCRIIDFVDSMTRVSGVISTPTLFGLDPGEITIDDETIQSLEKRAVEAIARDNDNGDVDNVPRPILVTYTDHENPFSNVTDTSGAPHIAGISRNAWVGCGNEIFVLPCLGEGFLRVTPVSAPEGQHYAARYTPFHADQKGSFTNIPIVERSRQILLAETLQDAIQGCDTFIAKTIAREPRVALGILRTAKWRKSPATDGQKELIHDRWIKTSPIHADEGSIKKRLEKMTKGDAANIIIRIKHGAQSRYTKKLKSFDKAAIIASKEQLRRNREVVTIGPLWSPDQLEGSDWIESKGDTA